MQGKTFRNGGKDQEDPCRLLIEVEQREHAAEIAGLIQACGVRLYALTPHIPSLEELFFRVMQQVQADEA